MRLTINDSSKIENEYQNGNIGYAEYKILMNLALKEKEIKEDKMYCVGVDTRVYKWLGLDLIELCKLFKM